MNNWIQVRFKISFSLPQGRICCHEYLRWFLQTSCRVFSSPSVPEKTLMSHSLIVSSLLLVIKCRPSPLGSMYVMSLLWPISTPTGFGSNSHSVLLSQTLQKSSKRFKQKNYLFRLFFSFLIIFVLFKDDVLFCFFLFFFVFFLFIISFETSWQQFLRN